ncbi:uncharacterized protein DUF4345 [Chitinophaga skermanii]|uniref:Uncharacterized protein DUF4345 n=1 Tax=Chitinophaga skermanii TaxID=331697 RepID=A0A327QLL1_9BACT|nr:DUF4345 family protein [Chitinophaga skermanii]RAJ05211.1 uncharacterized protein DUF4345 [Chitinophaga skermanii]
MRYLLIVKITLILAGIIGITVGIGQLFFPIAFEGSTGITLSNNTSLLSEFHGAGGTLLGAGIIILIGAFSTAIRGFALMLTALFYLGYGIARLYGMLADGLPNEGLIVVTVIEVVIGTLALVLYRQYKRQQFAR